MRVLFIGSQLLGRDCLEVLHDQGDEIVGVVTFEPEEHEAWSSEVAEFAEKNDLFYTVCNNINTPEQIKGIKALNPDIIYVIGWRQIIGKEILSIPEHGVVGIHFSLLPKFRGHAPVGWAILAGERETGLTLFYFSDRADAGGVIAQKTTPIRLDDDAGTVRGRLERLAVQTVKEYAPLLRAGHVIRQTQDESQASYGAYRQPRDGRIDWGKTSREVYDLIRATTKPYPGAWTGRHSIKMTTGSFVNRFGCIDSGTIPVRTTERITIWTSELIPASPKFYGTPGQIIRHRRNGIIVKTGDHAILIKDIQVEGEETQLANERFRSTKDYFA